MTGSSLPRRVLLSITAVALFALSGLVPREGAAQSTPTIETVNRGAVWIVAGGVDSTAARLAADLADALDDGATRRLLPILGKGSTQNVTDLRLLRGVDLAVLQLDVVTDLRDRKVLPVIEQSFTYVTKLPSEELHILAGEPVTSIQDLAGKRINVGPAGGGTAVTVAAVFQKLQIPVEITNFDAASAAEKLRSGEIAAIALVAGKPARAFGPGLASSGLHFIPVPLTSELGPNYVASTLTADDYPGVVPRQAPVGTIAVGTFLAAANLPPETERYRNMANFVDALFTQFDKLSAPGRYAKWREVDIRAELAGFRRFPPAEAWLKRNPAQGPAMADVDLKEIFIRFLEERSKLSGGAPLTQQRKDELFAQFQRWQQQQRTR